MDIQNYINQNDSQETFYDGNRDYYFSDLTEIYGLFKNGKEFMNQ